MVLGGQRDKGLTGWSEALVPAGGGQGWAPSVSFLGLCSKVLQNLLTHSPGGQKSEVRVVAGLVPSGGSEGKSVPDVSPGFWGLPATPGYDSITPVSASVVTWLSRVSVSLCPLPLRLPDIGQRP